MNDAVLGQVVGLMTASPIHRDWTVADIERLIVPPLMLGQYVAIAEKDQMLAFATYAFLSQEAMDGFVSGQRKLRASDWRSGPHKWLIDAIAPSGHARPAMGMVRAALRRDGYRGDVIRFRRNKGGVRRYAQVVL